MNLLVTGGAGHIGSVVSQRLIEEVHAVTGLNDLSKEQLDAVPNEARFVRGRSHDAAGDRAGARFDAVVHLAASDLYVDNHVTGTARSVRAAAAERAHRVLGWSPGRPELTTIVPDAWRFATQPG
jgi:UDP-glucose 4-epimerase